METTYTIGIDIGGTNTVVGVVATDGTILTREKFPTRSCGADFVCFTNRRLVSIHLFGNIISPERLQELVLEPPMATTKMVQ